MRFPPSLLDEIRARLPVSAVVARRVRLKRAGREYTGLSPFKPEKTPSFTVNDQKGFYHCFATGEHGDIFTFVMKTEGLSFPEAVERLAGEAGVALPKPSVEEEAHEAERDRLYRLMEAACAFFEDALAAPSGAEALNYLHRRGLSEETIKAFRLGYAPGSRSALKQHLADQGFSAADMATAGMVISGDDIPVPYDRFRNRVIFPITGLRGQVIAFGGRALDAEQKAKYLNSPETPLFHKGAVLFNAAKARRAAHDRGEVIVAEGYMDVIALASAGFAHAVAPLGTALTEAQLKLLWRMADEPILCFDGDSAGQRAAFRAAETALPHLGPGKSLRFALLSEGLDPDDLIREQGAGAMSAALEAAKPLVDMIWMREASAAEWTTPERRAALEQRLQALSDQIEDRAVRSYYARELRDRMFRLVQAARQPGGGRDGRQRFANPAAGRTSGQHRGQMPPWDRALAAQPSASLLASGLVRGAGLHSNYESNAESRATGSASAPASVPQREALIILSLVTHPWLLDMFAEEVAALRFDHPTARRLRDALLQIQLVSEDLDNMAVRHQLNKLDCDGALCTLERAMTHRSDSLLRADAEREEVLSAWRDMLTLHRRETDLSREVALAERAYADHQSEENFARLKALHAELAENGE